MTITLRITVDDWLMRNSLRRIFGMLGRFGYKTEGPWPKPLFYRRITRRTIQQRRSARPASRRAR